jgi:hypothetical protein
MKMPSKTAQIYCIIAGSFNLVVGCILGIGSDSWEGPLMVVMGLVLIFFTIVGANTMKACTACTLAIPKDAKKCPKCTVDIVDQSKAA